MELRNVVLVDGIRTPFSRGGKGKFEATRMDEVTARECPQLLKHCTSSTLAEKKLAINNIELEKVDLHFFALPLRQGQYGRSFLKFSKYLLRFYLFFNI